MTAGERRTIDTIELLDREALKTTDFYISKDDCPPPSEWTFDIRQSVLLYYPTGELRAYREKREYNCIQVREYRTHYLIQLDRYHPHKHPIKHFRHDIPRRKKVALTAGAVMSSYALRRKRGVPSPFSVADRLVADR